MFKKLFNLAKPKKNTLKEIYGKDWPMYDKAIEEYNSAIDARVVQHVTSRYLDLYADYHKMNDADNVSDILTDIKVYELALLLLHVCSETEELSEELAQKQFKDSLSMLTRLVCPPEFNNGIPKKMHYDRILWTVKQLVEELNSEDIKIKEKLSVCN